jgi:hypothetical protein
MLTSAARETPMAPVGMSGSLGPDYMRVSRELALENRVVKAELALSELTRVVENLDRTVQSLLHSQAQHADQLQGIHGSLRRSHVETAAYTEEVRRMSRDYYGRHDTGASGPRGT